MLLLNHGLLARLSELSSVMLQARSASECVPFAGRVDREFGALRRSRGRCRWRFNRIWNSQPTASR